MVSGVAWRRAMWDAIGHALAAHAVMLRDVPILDDASAAAMLTTLDSVRRGDPPELDGALALVATFDERFDSLTAPGAVGAGRIARARHDLAATAQRLVLRGRALDLVQAQLDARGALIDLAEDHVFTLMPAWSGSSVLQPTNLAHFLSGTIAPLGRAARMLQTEYADLDRTPLGAGALAGPGLVVDREETADLLGSEGPVASTFDALAATDYLTATTQAAALAVAPLHRLLAEIVLWLRTEPQAIRLADELLGPADPNLPHYRPPAALERLVTQAREIELISASVAQSSWEMPYGPTSDLADHAVVAAGEALSRAAGMCQAFAAIVSGPMEINRAWLARNAGRGLVTAGELTDLLMAEENLDPASARDIAALTATRARQEGLEASGITPQMIDAAALLVIGRELGIELERLGAYLAPRRFVEKRTMLGGPAAPAVREYLAQERERLDADRRWLEDTRRRIALAAENLEIRTHEIVTAASSG